MNKKPLKTKILNQKQKLFVQNLLTKQMSPLDSYLSIYKVANKQVAASACSRLMANPLIKTELASVANQLKFLSEVPKHLLMTELKALLVTAKAEGNHKYVCEAIDLICKMSGYYNHEKTVTKININQDAISFGDWSPESAEIIDITPLPPAPTNIILELPAKAAQHDPDDDENQYLPDEAYED